MSSYSIWSERERKTRFGKNVSTERLSTLLKKRIRQLTKRIPLVEKFSRKKADRLKARLIYTSNTSNN